MSNLSLLRRDRTPPRLLRPNSGPKPRFFTYGEEGGWASEEQTGHESDQTAHAVREGLIVSVRYQSGVN